MWGSGSALVDYLIPIPVAGGALHVPSFVLLMVLVVLGPQLSAKAAGRARALALGALLTGGVLLLPPPEWRLSENPLGLFLAVDALVALLSLLGAPRQPGLRLEAGALLALLAMPALGAMVAWRALGLGESFVSGTATVSDDRALLSVHVEARGDITRADLRQRAQEWAMTLHDPAMKMGPEVAELRFTGPRKRCSRRGAVPLRRRHAAALADWPGGLPAGPHHLRIALGHARGYPAAGCAARGTRAPGRAGCVRGDRLEERPRDLAHDLLRRRGLHGPAASA